jgi:hypothetical protein
MEVQVKVKKIWGIGSKFVSLDYSHIMPNNAINRILELNIYPLQLSIQLTHNTRLEIELCAFNYFSINVGGGRV